VPTPPATASIRNFVPLAVIRTVRAPRSTGSVVSSVRASSSTRLGGSSATPCDTIVRAKSTGSPPAPRSGRSTTRANAFEYLEHQVVKLLRTGSTTLRELRVEREQQIEQERAARDSAVDRWLR